MMPRSSTYNPEAIYLEADRRDNTACASTDALSALMRLVVVRWPEFSIEAALLGLFMISACVFTVLFWLPSSPVPESIPSVFFRRVLTGAAMGLTAIALIYSPWGQRSGAHMNPSVTLTFCRLGKMRIGEAILDVLAQFVGGIGGVWIATQLLGSNLGRPEVRYAATYPGRTGTMQAVVGEFVISFVLMSIVLHTSNHPKLSRYTGLFAGLLVAAYIAFESPYSGMSMNPARTFASALPSGIWRAFWIYLIVPPLAMLTATELYTRTGSGRQVMCCKMYHNPQKDCTFCGRNGDHR